MKKLNFWMLIASVFFLFSCRTELEINEQTSDKDAGKGKQVTFQTMQKGLGNEDIQKEFKVATSSLSKTAELTDFVIDESKIVAVENSISDIHYSMAVYPKIPKEKNVFYNLMIRKRNGEISKTIYKYTPDKDWFSDYNNKIYRMYRGEIDLIYREGNFSSGVLSKYASCYEQFLEIPCEFGYYHDDAHCESTGSTMIKVTICQDMGGSPTISYSGDSGSSNGSGGSGGTPVTPLSLEEPFPGGNEQNNAYQAFKLDRRFSFDERQWLSLYRDESLNLFWYTYNMADQNKAFALAKKYIQFAIAGQNTNFSSFPFSRIMNFITDNPDVIATQFKDWFLKEPLNDNLQSELFEDWADPTRVKPTTKFKKNPLVNCVYNKAKSAANFNQYLKNFNGKFSTAHLIFDLKPLDPANNAETSTPLGYWITITINSNNLDRPSLDIARTFMHEIIHAEMFRILLSLASTSNGQINLTELTNMLNSHNYPGIYDYFRRYELNDMQHEQMAAHYRGIVKNFLKQIDNSLTDDQYEAIAWQGLQGTERWNQLTASQKASINLTYSNWYNTASHSCP